MPIKFFFCYAHEDELFLNKLKKYLSPLQRQGLIDVWYDHDISAGQEWEPEINKHLNEAHIILLLISPDFINSDYCYSIEMKRAIERHERREATVIPVILRPIYWEGTPFGKLQALPKDGKPIIHASWHTEDEAFFNVAEGVRKIIQDTLKKILSKDKVENRTQSPISQQLNPSFWVLADTIPQPVYTKPQINTTSLWRKSFIVIGSVIGSSLTIVGIIGFFITVGDPNSPAYFTDGSFIAAGLFMCFGAFIFCISAIAIIGRYIAGFTLMMALIPFFIGFFQPTLAQDIGDFIGSGIMVLLAGAFFGQHAQENGNIISKLASLAQPKSLQFKAALTQFKHYNSI